jgi:NAD(P)-dependent dehydrogenase (short-subunit alcohol dehydrogenase family)
MKLKGKTALITGAGSGIGQAIAYVFAQEGADIAVNDINRVGADKTCDYVRDKFKREAVPVIADISKAKSVDSMVAETMQAFGQIDILVNNAGILDQVKTPTIEQRIGTWDRVVRVHLKGCYLCCRRVGRQMVRQKNGCILSIASIHGISPMTLRTAYGPAKAGIINLTKMLAAEWAPLGIRVNALAPGYVYTALAEKGVRAGYIVLEELIKQVPLGRMGQPEEIARAALFLVSDDAAYITGVILPVDGGWLVNKP